jgi:hypothetical protein
MCIVYVYLYVCMYVYIYVYIYIYIYGSIGVSPGTSIIDVIDVYSIYIGSIGNSPGTGISGNYRQLNGTEQRNTPPAQQCKTAIQTAIGIFFYYLYVDSITYAFGWSAFLCRIRFCDIPRCNLFFK